MTTGDNAEVRLTAFKQRTMPTLQGHVTYVSADVEVEPKTGATYYRGRRGDRRGADRAGRQRQLSVPACRPR